MPLREELRKRVWPPRPKDVVMGDYMAGVYVREGHLVNRSLGLSQQVSEPIPDGECAITSLCLGAHGRVYGATSGRRSHLFYYDPSPGADGVCDVGVVEGATAVRRSLVACADGRIIGGVSAAADPDGEGYLFAYGTARDRSIEYETGSGAIQRLVVPVPGQCIAALAVDHTRRRVYGLSTPDGVFFTYNLDTGAVEIVGPVNAGKQFSDVLVLDRAGMVYGVGAAGQVFRYDPHGTTGIEHLDVRIPSVAGRDYYNKLDSAALCPCTGLIYGGGSADGVVFAFDPSTHDMRTLGKVTAEPRVRAITVGLAGRVYGVSGEPDGMAHLFCYDPIRHELRDLGLPFAGSQRHWHGYEFDAACTGPWGQIYLGESDRISHLWIYFPPVTVPPVPDAG